MPNPITVLSNRKCHSSVLNKSKIAYKISNSYLLFVSIRCNLTIRGEHLHSYPVKLKLMLFLARQMRMTDVYKFRSPSCFPILEAMVAEFRNLRHEAFLHINFSIYQMFIVYYYSALTFAPMFQDWRFHFRLYSHGNIITPSWVT